MESLAGGAITAYLGLGSNLGDRLANLRRARRMLQSIQDITVAQVSSVYETEPWGVAAQPRFLNCAAEIITSQSPSLLLETVKAIEQQMGRIPTFRYGPRTIDIDILLYGDEIVHREIPDLQIPHLRMAERAFVLVPLAQIAGLVLHPSAGVSISELAERLDEDGGVTYWGELGE